MEKLVMLLDIYEEEVIGVHSVGEKITDKEEARIISKKFGFIERLVENEKIDLETALIGLESNDRTSYTETEELLMLLAIQDEPIKFLCEILK